MPPFLQEFSQSDQVQRVFALKELDRLTDKIDDKVNDAIDDYDFESKLNDCLSNASISISI